MLTFIGQPIGDRPVGVVDGRAARHRLRRGGVHRARRGLPPDEATARRRGRRARGDRRARPRHVALTTQRAALLGALHGPAELLPVSSSAHVALAAGGALAPDAQKALEVALHAGSAPALLWLLRADAARGVALLDRRRLAFHAFALAPPAVVGGLLERPIEERLGGPRALAAGLVAGAALLVAADRATGTRSREAVTPADGLALGLAQAAALWPGVSRRGTTLAAARARGFARAEASALSWEVALPVLGAATTLKAVRLARGDGGAAAPPLLAGAAAAGAATLAAAPLLHVVDGRAWWPWAAHRAALAGLALRRVRQDARR